MDFESARFIEEELEKNEEVREIVISQMKSAIGMDEKKIYNRNGKRCYKPHQNFHIVSRQNKQRYVWGKLCNCGFAKCSDLLENKNPYPYLSQSECQSEPYYFAVTGKGLKWLSDATNISISGASKRYY